jgi:uroporphyrinogen decarboxylase
MAAMSLFLDAALRKPTPSTPVWLMRQAGRYQPSYRAIREKVGFMELCKDPALCAEVALRAVDDLGVDAAIMFSDILVVLEPLGVGFEFTKGEGPSIPQPLRSAADIDRVKSEIDPKNSLGYVMSAITETKRALNGRVPLLGFSGAPFTLASYMIEGGGSREYSETKKLMRTDEGAWHALLEKISDAVIRYLSAQIDAGIDAFQLFDSWAGALGPRDYQRFVMPHSKRIFDALGGRVPSIHFGAGNPALLTSVARAGGDVIGIDQRAPFRESWDLLGDRAVQGNLDPTTLLGPEASMLAEAAFVLDEAQGRPGHIFNLGHGMLPGANVAQTRALVTFVKEESERRREKERRG